MSFESSQTFQALRNAQKILEADEYHSGTLCGDEPVGISKNFNYIAKWKNLSTEERGQVDGVMLSSNFREGKVFVVLFKTKQEDESEEVSNE